MTTDTRSQWEMLVDASHQFFTFGVSLSVLAILAAAWGVWAPGARIATLAFGLLSAHAFTCHHLIVKLARLRAALDMKRTLRDAAGTQFISLAADERLTIEGKHLIIVDRYVCLEITPK